MATVQGIANHDDVQNSYAHHEIGNFKKEEDTIYAFWANDVERDNEGNFIEHHGKAVALAFQKRSAEANERPVVLMGNFEGKNDIPVLDDCEKRRNISPHVINSVCALASVSYAKSAQSTIVTSVKGAASNSFFRTNELPVIMNNPNITEVIIVSRDDPVGTYYSKKDAYHILRDEWLKSETKKFKEATEKFKNSEIHPEIYQSAVDKMSAEAILSIKALNKIKLALNVETEYQDYDISDIARELVRAKRCKKLTEEYPVLAQKIKAGLSANDETIYTQILSRLHDKTTTKSANIHFIPTQGRQPRLHPSARENNKQISL